MNDNESQLNENLFKIFIKTDQQLSAVLISLNEMFELYPISLPQYLSCMLICDFYIKQTRFAMLSFLAQLFNLGIGTHPGLLPSLLARCSPAEKFLLYEILVRKNVDPYLPVKLNELETHLVEQKNAKKIDDLAIENAIQAIFLKWTGNTIGVVKADAFVMLSPFRASEQTLDELTNNPEILVRYNHLREKYCTSLEPSVLLPLPAPIPLADSDLLLPLSLCPCAPGLAPISAKNQVRELLQVAPTLSDGLGQTLVRLIHEDASKFDAEMFLEQFDTLLVKNHRLLGKILSTIKSTYKEVYEKCLQRFIEHESYLKVLETLEFMKLSLVDNQPFFVRIFENLIHSGEKLVKDNQARKLRIIVNYIKRFYQENMIDQNTLKSIWNVFSVSFPASNKSFKEFHDILYPILKNF